jgi:probable phosphoglycerate mutase
MTTIFLVRHAATIWNDAGRYLGRTDLDLGAHGESQAQQLGHWAATAGIDLLLTSPARRAARTAAVVGARIGLSPRSDERLREIDFGVAEGRTLAEVRTSDPEMVRRFEADPVAHPFPGGEDPAEAARRIRAAIAEVLTTGPAHALVITHNTLLRLFLCDALGVPLAEYRRRFPVTEHCAVTEVSFANETFALLRFNAAIADCPNAEAQQDHPAESK